MNRLLNVTSLRNLRGYYKSSFLVCDYSSRRFEKAQVLGRHSPVEIMKKRVQLVDAFPEKRSATDNIRQYPRSLVTSFLTGFLPVSLSLVLLLGYASPFSKLVHFYITNYVYIPHTRFDKFTIIYHVIKFYYVYLF